ncbi:hypothetical protein Ae201684P_010677 [Aphanomyces euteiches]|uniref:Uncharacterized protein n=1 Tax=Aphanomyces euteiches TaxID=100861 RepID=A0A6G0WPA3_9STRA|nr:hypothetical protein Ae201684_013177 [Aphanomyces euteiches]KAH9076743.1 hypothetical protein Ae201684P_010677 [Aphanomyces euteiches]
MPHSLRTRILSSIRSATNIHPQAVVPQIVSLIPIVPSGFDGQLKLLELGNSFANEHDQSSNASTIMAAIHGLSTEINVVKMRLEEIHCQNQGEMMSTRSMFRSQLDRIHSSLKSIAIQPVVRSSIQTSNMGGASLVAAVGKVQLSKRPRDLYELWKEYEFGLGGNKPAKHFTEKEHGTRLLLSLEVLASC